MAEDKMTVECKCGGEKFLVIKGTVQARIQKIGDCIRPIPDETDDEVMLIICAECNTVIDMGVVVLDINGSFKEITKGLN